MAIVAKKKGGALAQGGACASRWGWRGIVLSGAAMLVALAAVLAWRAAGQRPTAEAGASAAPDPLWGRYGAPRRSSEDKLETQESTPICETLMGNADLRNSDDGAAVRSESSHYQKEAEGAAADQKPLTPQEEWAIADSNRLAKSEAIMLAHAPKKHFDNDVENTIEVVSKPGARFLQIPRVDMDPDEVLEYLRKPVEIYDDDDAETVAAKERTATFKQEALKFVEEGGTLNQYIRDVVAVQTEANETVEDVRREKTRILKSQGLEAAQAYLDEMNPQLREAGLPEVKLGRLDYKILRDAEKEAEGN